MKKRPPTKKKQKTQHRPQYDETVMFDWLAETIDNILTEYLTASFNIHSEFNIHHKERLVHLNESHEGRYCRDFSVAYKLTSFNLLLLATADHLLVSVKVGAKSSDVPFHITTKTAQVLTWLKLFFQPSSNKLHPKLLPSSWYGSFLECRVLYLRKKSTKNQTVSSSSPP